MKIVQCWDDGVTSDIRLCNLLRKFGAKASFNLNPGLYGEHRGSGFEFEGTNVLRLSLSELRDVYDGFTIANHTISHPFLTELSPEQIFQEINDGRKQLQDIFQQPVEGFAYPFGKWNEASLDALRKTGHLYARTVTDKAQCYPPKDPMEFHATCHFRDERFWQYYEQAKACGVFYFWGHSFEMTTESRWRAFEKKLERIAQDATTEWSDLPELFQ
jgi:peptidoglycan/xylan/chitin deacetylase (PgdA/CDA1 family)